ncbi:MAG: hypothetical protein GWN58_49005 [Anaerolineae bacterium]|nr:hypothetical protein [Anaerolineae bacterium]
MGGCAGAVPPQLMDQSLCLEHFLGDVQERCHNFSRHLESVALEEELRQTATKFIMLSAAKIATIGMENPPNDQLDRGRLLNAMLLLAELRDRFDKLTAAKRKS